VLSFVLCDGGEIDHIELNDKLPEFNPRLKKLALRFKKLGDIKFISMLNSEVATSGKTGLELIKKHLKADGSTNITDVAEQSSNPNLRWQAKQPK
jgi:hypothetical protein